jgi:hypothetical protein
MKETIQKDLMNNRWNLIIISDQFFLTSKSVINFFKVILQKIEFKYVILDRIEGSPAKGQNWPLLPVRKDIILNTNDLLNLLQNINQLDWGDFFFFKEYPKNWSNKKNQSYPSVIAQSDTAIRLVDNQFFYVYTPYEQIKNCLENKYDIESYKIDFLNQLEYPE